MQQLISPTVITVISVSLSGISRQFSTAALSGSADSALLTQFALAFSAMAKTLSIISVVWYTASFTTVFIVAYMSRPKRTVVSTSDQYVSPQLSQATERLVKVQKELAEAQRDLNQTKTQRERNERLLSLTNEQIKAVKLQIGEDVRRSGKWPLILGIAGFVAAVAGVAITFALAP